MARPTTFVPIVTALLLAATWGCTTKKQEAPSLTGPSELGTSISITVSPDVLRQDGASQSLVTVTARDNAGQPLRNLTLRAEITVGGIITDFGSLSARNVVTDTSGRATFIYTAPNAGPIAIDTGTIVGITVSPMGTDFGNATSKTVDIRLVPSGVIGAPPSSLRVAITMPAAVVGDTAVFTANITDSSGADASGQVASYLWNFGDGGTAAGRTASHTYSGSGNFPVSLTITDVLGRVGQTSQALTVSPGVNPTATFLVSPASPNVGQSVGFNASTAVAAPGHSITSYAWDFGDGSVGGGPTTTHTYSAAGSYTVILITTDDVGRRGTSSVGVAVGVSSLTAEFNFSPTSPLRGQSVSFDGSPSRAATGRTITNYAWNWDDGTTGSGVQQSHTFNTTGTFNVRLTITDDLGQTTSATRAVTVGAATLTASFTFSPSSPLRGQTVNFDASGSRAATGRTITQYAWNFDDGGTAFGVTTSHTFNTTGTFNVRLTVTDDIGQTNSVAQLVTVGGAAPTASFTFSPSSPLRGQTVNFDASSSRAATGRTITQYAWNFDDGGVAFGVTAPHAFNTTGTFNVRLTVTDDIGQTNNVAQLVTVGGAAPTAAFTFSPSAPATGQSVQFDASQSRPAPGRTITAYAWNFDDGTTGPGIAPSHAFTTARVYAVRLTVTDDFGQTGTTSQNVTVSGVSPVSASFTFSPSTPSTGQSVAFDASSSRAASGHSIVSYAWNFDDGTGATLVTTSTSHVFTTSRTFVVRLTVTDDVGQTNTATANVTVSSSAPTANYTFQPATPTVGQTVNFDASISTPGSGRTIASYSWNFGDGSTFGSGVAPSHAYTAAGTYNVTLTVTDDIGQTNSRVQTIPVGTASAAVASFVFTPTSPQPAGTTFTFDASQSKGSGSAAVSRYQWQFLGNPNTAGACPGAPIAPSTRGSPAGPVVVVFSPTTTFTFNTPETYCVVLTVFDNQGNSNTTGRLLTIQ